MDDALQNSAADSVIEIRSKRWCGELARYLILSSIALYLAACFLPAVSTWLPGLGSTDEAPLRGYQCLTIWWMTAWWSNPAMLLGIWIWFAGVRPVSAMLGCLSAVLAVSGVIELHLLAGGFLWLISIGLFTATAIWSTFLPDRYFQIDSVADDPN